MGEVIAFPNRRRATLPSPTPPAHRPESNAAGPSPEPAVAQRFAVPRTPAADAPAERLGPHLRRAPTREPLWREVAGAVLRDERRRQDRTLAQVAARAGMSVQYLSELERGRKEASSEMLAAACGSLGLGLAEFAQRCAGTISSVTARPAGPVLLAA